MIDAILAKIFGTRNDREVKKILPVVEAINALEPAMRELSDAALTAKTTEFRERHAQGETLDDLLVEAFAVVREAGRRVVNMRHFDVQLIGGAVLHKGMIAEMRTGEGKTLVATLPVYLNSLEGKGVHVVTVNDYLAKRDSEWMGKIYKFLGLSVGVIVHELDDEERHAAYRCDITYGTNNEYGFDYLRDNMKFRLSDCVQRGHHFAIVDEVDSILIDEARTPLIISGPSEESTDKYYRVNGILPKLVRGEVIEGKEPGEKYTTGDYTLDEKNRTVALTEEGALKVERLLGLTNLYDPINIEMNHHVQQALRAHVMFHRDKDYLVREGQVVIVDEFTGRIMPGRRWSDGLHQAIEAKEGVKIERENQTLATITFQNYFRMYKKLAGMTGTAETEAAEFGKTYKLDVLVAPTNRPMVRKDGMDMVYRTEEEKFRNAAKEIKECQERGQPVLVGTISVDKSERLSSVLKRIGVRHEVLNAKNHEREAYLVAQAGLKAVVTVSTNMAGRGTDILLGGNPEYMTKEACLKQGIAQSIPPEQASYVNDDQFVYFQHLDQFYRVSRPRWDEIFAGYKVQCDLEHDEVVAAGGLHILGTERHESRRIDNQLRGRAGRQGDPGSSRFFLSLQDDLLRIFGGDRIQNLMLRLGMEEDVPIESGLITKRIASAQKAVEAQNFAARKHLLEYDDVMNKQRQAVYGLRNGLLGGLNQRDRILEIVRGIAASFIDARCGEQHPSNWDLSGLESDVLTQFGVRISTKDLTELNKLEMEDFIVERLNSRYVEKEQLVGEEVMRETECFIMLHVIDTQWKDHLLSMDHLKEGIGLRSYGQKDPLIEYKKESYQMFNALMDRIEDETIRYLFFLQTGSEESHSGAVVRPMLPFNPDADDEEEEEAESGSTAVAVSDAQRAAQASLQDFTRNIVRKKEREMAQLQFAGGDSSTEAKGEVRSAKVGRNEPCPCGSGKKYKKCCGS
ncbi:MAG: preprotein translocase subunit SecA [Candidatus Solibacter usitatus]|nr:preprotein translocase subunit SecA [Candidatus Solibacter usitatus]